MSTFTEYIHELQYAEIFPRFKEEKIDIDGDIHDIVWEECDDYINKTYDYEVEQVLFAHGFSKAMEIYDCQYGMESLKDIADYKRIRCLLQCAIIECIHGEIVEKYKKWYNENKDEDEEGGY